MTKAFEVKIILPEYIHNYLQKMAMKMTKIPITDENGNIIPNPYNKKAMPMVNTGKVVELIHQSILTSIWPLVMTHPAFVEERTTINEFREEYGNFLSNLVNNHFMELLKNNPDALKQSKALVPPLAPETVEAAQAERSKQPMSAQQGVGQLQKGLPQQPAVARQATHAPKKQKQ